MLMDDAYSEEGNGLSISMCESMLIIELYYDETWR